MKHEELLAPYENSINQSLSIKRHGISNIELLDGLVALQFTVLYVSWWVYPAPRYAVWKTLVRRASISGGYHEYPLPTTLTHDPHYLDYPLPRLQGRR